jgi:glycosyltransferase involved in cell wall biosynthesis
VRIAEIAPVWVPVPPPTYGGIEAVVSLLADGLAGRGHEVTLFAAKGSESAAKLVSPVDEAHDLSQMGNIVTDEIVHAMPAYLHAEDFDVIHDHTGLGVALGAVRRGSPPVVHTLHGPWIPSSCRFFEAVSPPVHLIAISEAQKAGNPNVDYAGVVHNGLDLSTHPWRKEKDDFLLFLGRCNPEKGPELAVEVANRADMPLVMVVKRSEEHEQAHWDKEVAPRLRGTEEIIFDASHEDKVDFLGRARATLFPIQWPEPFGLVMIESMACGTPVIAMAQGAAPEVVADGETGFLCDDVDGMLAALERLDEISPEDCRAHVEDKFSGDAMVEKTEAILQRLVDEAK